MRERNCMEMLNAKFSEGKNVCVGLDTDPKEISEEIDDFLRGKHHLPPSHSIGPLMSAFNKEIIKATCDIVDAYKFNLKFYLAELHQGLWALQESIAFAKEAAPDVPLILDSKDGDVGVSMKKAAEFAFDRLGIDAVTVNPWGGYGDGLDAFFEYIDKCIFVWCRSSNTGAKNFQNPLYKRVASYAVNNWNDNGNCGLVVGATYPRGLECVRKLVGNMPILIPGIGAQGGDLKAAVRAGGLSTAFNSSRGVIYKSKGLDFAQAARAEVIRLQTEIDKSRSSA